MVLETRELQFKSLVGGNHFNDSATLSLLPPSQMNSEVPKAAAAVRPKNQLTIFYAGSVNVFDDVPEEKAHAIMLLAGNATAGNMSQLLGSLGSLAAAQAPPNLSQFCEPAQKVRKLPGMVSPSANNSNNNNNNLLLSLNSHFVRPTTPTFNSPNLPKIACPAVSSQSLPQARKASLTRFLQRRKERALQQSMESTKEEKTNSDFSVQNQSQECSNAVQEGHSALKKENSMGTTIEA